MNILLDEVLVRQMVEAGAQAYIVKGQTEGAALLRTLRDAIARHRAREQKESASLLPSNRGQGRHDRHSSRRWNHRNYEQKEFIICGLSDSNTRSRPSRQVVVHRRGRVRAGTLGRPLPILLD